MYCINQIVTVHIFFSMYIVDIFVLYIVHIHARYIVHIHAKYIFHTKYISKKVHLYAKYIILPCLMIHWTHSYQVHLHTKYLSIPSTSSYQVHLHAKYIFIPSTSLNQVHIHTKYTSQWKPSYQIHCTYSCHEHLCAMYIVHIHAMNIFVRCTLYIFMPWTSLCDVHIHTKYTFKPRSHSRQVHIYGTGGWHPAAGPEGDALPTVAFSALRWLRVPHCQPCQTWVLPPPCKIDSSNPCPIPTLQSLFVPTGWLHFFPWYRLHICFLHGKLPPYNLYLF